MLLEYLSGVIYNSNKTHLNISALPQELQEFGTGLQYFCNAVIEMQKAAQALSKGDLTVTLPSRDNELASPLKSLHASLKHLTWQAQRIAEGDYSQRVHFMGDFSHAFNTMVEQLADRRQKLEDTITQMKSKSASLEQGNLLFASLMQYVPQQIVVIDRNSGKVLLTNPSAENEIAADANYINYFAQSMATDDAERYGRVTEIVWEKADRQRFFEAACYYAQWNGSDAEIYVINDITQSKSDLEKLEKFAFYDSLTQLYNRAYGMILLENWLREKRKFVLVFADLDSLKYVNDAFGHHEGDLYIINAGKYLQTFSNDAIVCRLGGDEFMLVALDHDNSEAETKMEQIYTNLSQVPILEGKTYSYSISYGIVAVDVDDTRTTSEILSLADDNMYLNKRMKKKIRAKARKKEKPHV
ncbi:MAG: diguanylate cyclase [Defluviitaleaceae bacterium]|nr:diguanylate cyclase [Defluviitaleaceae bacterium]